MRLETYTATPGLEGYPQQERFAVWRAAHKQLMQDDPEYRKRFNAYLSSMFCLASVMVVSGVGGFSLAGLAIALIVDLVVTVCFMAAIIYLALQQQRFMNQRIGDVLKSERAF